MYPSASAAEVAAALEDLNKSEVAIERVFGESSIHEMWGDPFSAANLKRTADHQEDFRQVRLLAEKRKRMFIWQSKMAQIPPRSKLYSLPGACSISRGTSF
ncbi:MAG TPA: hypothetical protein VK335_04285 [Bryobacteraceae bacterium]|nr:hypothetical protein [Bryobacteraceae bacterium]